ncbi:kynureninase [Halospeciosus flavus]|uniref:Kynureninase n=1 Tax=Halospeciosus flavus TaxID=3032283 RepID=A0ABD5Z5L5_9EURY|nr:kynureninase [Halospeciosus flavus]
MPDTTREGSRERDAADPLREFRDRFDIPDDYYVDGNSLGPISTDAERALDRVVEEWRTLGIRGWTDGDPPWFHYGEFLGERLAPLVGAREHEVVAANSTTVNIHTLVGTFLDRLDDPLILLDELNFPTDTYAVRAQLRNRGYDPDDHTVVVESEDGRTIDEAAVEAALTDDVDLVFLPSVLYRSGQLIDLEHVTAAAHAHDAFVGFDLAHSVGVVPHDLHELGVDFAVWCSYKYLNAGPGAIAGLYVHERHHERTPALAGWWGHEKETQFELRDTYTPAASAGAWQIGTVPILAAAPLEGSLDVVHEASIEAIREKSLALTDYLVTLVEDRLDDDFAVGTPRDPDRRGGHVAVEHPEAYRITEALSERGVVGDFRPPNVVRICPAPIYTGFEDVYDVVEALHDVATSRAYESVEPHDGSVT